MFCFALLSRVRLFSHIGKSRLNLNMGKKKSKKTIVESVIESTGEASSKKTVKPKKNRSTKAGDSEEDISKEIRQELEVFVKNLNNEGQLMKGFVLRDEDVPAADDALSSDEGEKEDDEAQVNQSAIQSDEVSSSTVSEKKKEKKKKKKNTKIKENNTDIKEEEDEEVKVEVQCKEEEVKADYSFLKAPITRNFCVVKAGGEEKWHERTNEDIDEDMVENEYWVKKIECYAQKLLDAEVANFQKSRGSKSSDKQWIASVIKSGTLTDKISAYSVTLQESPVQNLSALESLIGMVSLKSRRPCILALDALKDLFANHLLAPGRKLRLFRQNPFKAIGKLSGGNKDTRDRYLVLWLFEAKLKEMYKSFLSAVADVSKDTIDNTRMKTMSIILELLIANPEQEQELLARLVNKLGDPTRSVAAKGIYQLGRLLEVHPAMTNIVLEEVERLLYRPNVSPKAQYYGICCLTQLVLDEEQTDMANKLITIYFSFFKRSVKQGEIDSKLVSALLTGVNRAYPFAKLESSTLDSHVETMYRVAQISTSANISLQAFMLLFQVMGSGETVTDRFYTAFYKKMLDPNLASSSKPALFLNLAFKILKSDQCVPRVIAFVKRLLQVAQYQPPHLVCSVLFLLSELFKARPELNALKHVEESTLANDTMAKMESDDEDDDYRKDVQLSDDEQEPEENEEDRQKPSSSWVHTKVQKSFNAGKGGYDPMLRNPMYACADKTNNWEFSEAASHFHPSVALFAQTMLSGSHIKYSGDPLQDFTLVRFLDRFVFRNPKKDPIKGRPQSAFSKRNVYQPKGIKKMAPDSKEYLNKDISEIPLDERFIYKFLRDKRDKQADEEDSDAASVNSEDWNEAINMSVPDGGMAEDLDFAAAVDTDRHHKSQQNDDDDDDDDDDDESDDSDDEVDDIDDDDDEKMSTEDFEEVEDFDDLQDDLELEMEPLAKKAKKLKKAGGKKGDLQSLLASADEFASLMDENTVPGQSTAGHKAVFNRDKSSVKQMKWEEKRHDDFRGHGKKRKSFGQKKIRK